MSDDTHLTAAQMDGTVCVVCSRDLLTDTISSVPVGSSETGSQIFACVGTCEESRRPCPKHPEFCAAECEICNCRDCGYPIDDAARALGYDTCSACIDKQEIHERASHE